MPRNPLEDAGRALRQLGDRLRETAGPEGEWIAEQLDRLSTREEPRMNGERSLGEAPVGAGRARRPRNGQGADARARRVPPGSRVAGRSTGFGRPRPASTSSSSATRTGKTAVARLSRRDLPRHGDPTKRATSSRWTAPGLVGRLRRPTAIKTTRRDSRRLTGCCSSTRRMRWPARETRTTGPRPSNAAKIGVGAAIGAAIGAIAGGGKGAAVGAGVGGAAGTGDVLMSRGKPVEIPVETRLSFRLSEPITITERLTR